MRRFVVVFALFCCSLSVPAESIAADAGCTRPDLQGAVDGYLAALKNGKPSLMALAPEARYIENRKEMPFGEGVWKEPVAPDFHRSLLDVDICESFTEIINATGAHPYVIGTRLKVAGNAISEVEALVTDKDDWLFNASNYLKYSSQEKWDILSPEKRSDRETLIKAANAYFDVFKDFSTASASNVPWGIPCARLEGGMYTNPNGDPNASCTGGPPLEGSVQIVNRRFIVDEDMGTVVGLVDFGGKDGWPDSHTFRLEGGKVRFVHTLTVCPNGCEIPSPKK